MKTFLRMLMAAALASSAAIAFGQSPSGQTPSTALAAMAAEHSSVVSGSLPDADTLVKLGLNANQATDVIGIWGQARLAVAAERAQLRLLNASGDQSGTGPNTDPAVTSRANLEDSINGKLSVYKDQIRALIGSNEFSKISPFLGHRQVVTTGTWGEEKARGISS
jgi:hypothetical protein